MSASKFFKASSIFIIFATALSADEELPPIFRKTNFSSEDLTVSVNKFIEMGEKFAVSELVRLGWETNTEDGFSKPERAFWILSVVYQPKDPEDNRYLSGLDIHPPEDCFINWPTYPILNLNGALFAACEGISGTGVAVTIVDYIAWCQRHGTFRRGVIRHIDKEEKQKILENHFKSPKWSNMLSINKKKISSSRKKEIEDFIRKQLSGD